jgi:uncharacterized glyoxalase superfamily protein PhnB
MSDKAPIHHNVFSGMQYADALAAIDFLERAFGFTRHAVYPGDGGRAVAHAELRAGENGGIVMLGSTRTDSRAYRSPKDAGGVTHGIYIVVKDIDAHHARAKAAGAEVIHPLEDTDYGSRNYTVRDPEGFLWSFGTYDPENPDV